MTFFDSLKSIYQNNLESVRGSAFAFPYTQLLCYKIHLYHTSTSPDWIKNKRAKINPINKK